MWVFSSFFPSEYKSWKDIMQSLFFGRLSVQLLGNSWWREQKRQVGFWYICGKTVKWIKIDCVVLTIQSPCFWSGDGVVINQPTWRMVVNGNSRNKLDRCVFSVMTWAAWRGVAGSSSFSNRSRMVLIWARGESAAIILPCALGCRWITHTLGWWSQISVAEHLLQQDNTEEEVNWRPS